MGKDRRRQIYVGFVVDIDIKILGVPPLGARHAFLRPSKYTTKEKAVVYAIV
jgi:hypothetical protein